MKKKKKTKLLLPLCIAVVIIIAIVISIPLFKKITTKKDPIIGSWTTDGVTIYTFNEDNTGVLKVSLSEYEFTYTKDKESIFIDFKNERSEDVKYTYTLKDDKLVLKSVNGTFNFKRK